MTISLKTAIPIFPGGGPGAIEHRSPACRQRPGEARRGRRGYNRRGALERINARLDGSFRYENHFVRGRRKMQMRLGLALAA